MTSYIDTVIGTEPESYINSYDEMPTRLEMAIALFTRTGTSEGFGSVHARSIRIPTIENMTIEALASYSGLSVNKVITQLLQVALDEVFQGLTNEQRNEIFAKRSALMAATLDKEGFPVFADAVPSKEGDF